MGNFLGPIVKRSNRGWAAGIMSASAERAMKESKDIPQFSRFGGTGWGNGNYHHAWRPVAG